MGADVGALDAMRSMQENAKQYARATANMDRMVAIESGTDLSGEVVYCVNRKRHLVTFSTVPDHDSWRIAA